MHLYSPNMPKNNFHTAGSSSFMSLFIISLLFGIQWRVINNPQLVGGCLTGSVSLADSNNDYSVLISDLTE